MAIIKITYGSTGSTSFERADSVLHISGNKFRFYGDHIEERELSEGDKLEILDSDNVVVYNDEKETTWKSVAASGVVFKNQKGDVTLTLGEQEAKPPFPKPNNYKDLLKELHELDKDRARIYKGLEPKGFLKSVKSIQTRMNEIIKTGQ